MVTGVGLAGVGRMAVPAARGIGWLWRKWRPDLSAKTLSVYSEELADLVQDVELRRLGELGVVRGEEVGVRWNALAANRTVGSRVFGSLHGVRPYFEGLDTARLVIVGDPGSGKTVTALHLLLDLLDRREGPEHDRGPVPVRVNVSSWDPGSSSLAEWISRRIAEDYSLRLPVTRRLVETARILPVLDGLDEMDHEAQEPRCARAALDQLNETQWRGRPIVITCRANTYRQAGALGTDSGLHGGTVVALQSLSTPQIVAYLGRRRSAAGVDKEQWTAVRDRLNAEPAGVLATSLRTPWLLGLTIHFLMNATPNEAAELVGASSREAVEDSLFSALIPSAVAALPRDAHGNRKYSEKQVITWLRTLARHFSISQSRTGGNDFALDAIWEVTGRLRCRLLHAVLASAAAFTSLLGLAMYQGWEVAISAGWLCALVCGIRGGWPSRVKPRKMLWRTHKQGGTRRWMRALSIGSVVGIAVGVCVAQIYEAPDLPTPLSAAEMAALWGGCVALCVILAVGLTGHRQPHLDEKRVIREDTLAAVYVGGLIWLVLALIMSLLALPRVEANVAAIAVAVAPLSVLIMALVATPIGVIIITLIFLARAKASVRYACAKLLFGTGTSFTSAPGPFLDWARRAGLLRVTGAAYQFRHQSYQRWLASHS